MSAAEFLARVEIPGAGRIQVEAIDSAEVWVLWSAGASSTSSFISTAKARELAAALTEAADATDEVKREAESAVKL